MVKKPVKKAEYSDTESESETETESEEKFEKPTLSRQTNYIPQNYFQILVLELFLCHQD